MDLMNINERHSEAFFILGILCAQVTLVFDDDQVHQRQGIGAPRPNFYGFDAGGDGVTAGCDDGNGEHWAREVDTERSGAHCAA